MRLAAKHRKPQSEETKRKRSNSLKGYTGKNHYNFGKKASDSTKQKMIKSRTGKLCSETTKEKLRLSLLNHNVSTETRNKMSKTRKGKIPWNKGRCKQMA